MRKKDVWKISFRSHKWLTLKYALSLNCLNNGNLESESRLFYFLHRYHRKINDVCESNNLKPLIDLIEYKTYDIQQDTPDNLKNYIIKDAKWTPTDQACTILQSLHDTIDQNSVRFGCFPNHSRQVLDELDIAMQFLKRVSNENGQCNLCLISAPEYNKYPLIWG